MGLQKMAIRAGTMKANCKIVQNINTFNLSRGSTEFSLMRADELEMVNGRISN